MPPLKKVGGVSFILNIFTKISNKYYFCGVFEKRQKPN
jgi:hypothetical protein